MLVFTALEFQVRCLTLFLLFSVIDSFESLWMGSLHKNILIMLEFLKALFFVQHFPYSTLMIFLIMLSRILLSVPMILFSNLSVIRHRICDNNENWLLNLDWDWDRRWFINFNAGKTQLLSFDWSNNADAIDVKMDGSVLEE